MACLIGLLVYSSSRGAATNVARIYRQNDLIFTLDLEKEGEERDLDVEGTHSPMVFTVKKGAIKVKYSGCPSQYCVHQGYHSGKDGPLVCAYNGVYVTFEGGAGGNVVVVG